MKTCSKCLKEKPLDGFARFGRSPDGRQYRCRDCMNAYASAWNKSNPERCRINNHNARARDPKRAKMHDRKRHEKNRAARIAGMTEYSRRHPQKAAARHAARRARLVNASGSHTELERDALMASYSGLCVYCVAVAKDMDHVVPLARGGCDHIDNLAPACARCNRSKGASTLLEFLIRKAA